MTICPSDTARPRIEVRLEHAALRLATTRLPLAARLSVQDVATRGEILRLRVAPGPQAALIDTACGGAHPPASLPATSGLRLPLLVV